MISKGETESLNGGRADPVDFAGSVLVSLHEVSNGSTTHIAYAETIGDRRNNGLLTFKTSGTGSA